MRSPRGGLVRTARRPAGWIAPGPRPPADEPPDGDASLWPGEGEDLCWLAGDWRILQRVDGHRWSLDDLATAWYAARAREVAPTRCIDLGCGIGTVLLFTAWRFPLARCVGVEAQALSAGLAQRSLRWNGVTDRCEVRLGDFRQPEHTPEGAVFDLVTGTPPYFPHGTGLQSDHVQRAPARFEHRGGVEAYVEAAARLLAPGGTFVACQAAIQADRVEPAVRAAGLTITRWMDIVPREGKPPLVVLFACKREAEPRIDEAPLVVRGRDLRWTPAFAQLRLDMGLPPAFY
jgi:tRNA1Val (adenine37-N6)-methyltransferase